jgi:murein DD-endopeptidase MepM/ murein hydrolase activator NlpD
VITRRLVVAGGTALMAAPLSACASLVRISFSGTLEQGSLLVGRTTPGARVTIDDQVITVSSEGFFAWGLEWNRTTAARMVVQLSNGSTRTRKIVPILRHYTEEVITGLPPETVTPPPDALDRIHREHELIAAARRKESDLVWFAEPLDWPAPGIVSGVFGSRRIDNGKPMSPHMGVDVANVEGTPIRAPANATVSLSDDYYLEGGFTLLDHGHGVSTCYLHQSGRKVREGDTVRRGEIIGTMGQSGRATGPHLHWAMNWFQVRLDPSLSTRTALPPRT